MPLLFMAVVQHWRPSSTHCFKMVKSSNRSTLLLLTTACIVFYFIFKTSWLLYIAACIGLMGVLSDYLGNLIVAVWDKLSQILGLIVPSLILIIIFYCVLYPIALLSRLSRKDVLMLDKHRDSFFVIRKQQFSSTDFEKTW